MEVAVIVLLMALMVFGGKYIFLALTVFFGDKDALHSLGNLCEKDDPRSQWQARLAQWEWDKKNLEEKDAPRF